MPQLENADSYRHATDDTLRRAAQQVIEREQARCTIFSPDAESALPRFETTELQLGRVLGRGGFCAVREIVNVKLSDQQQPREALRWKRKRSEEIENTLREVSSREELARKIYNKKGGRFVVKYVEPEFLETDRVTFLKGLIDLALETKYLASLSHTHILRIRGISAQSPLDDLHGFIVIDQLTDILSKRLTAWMHTKRSTRGIAGLVSGGKAKKTKLLIERLLVAYDIADVLAYLHSRNIIYRDLKPDNIGFDAEGILKIFDLGLAKELIESEKNEDGLYHMTGFTGAIRYMAPEVGLQKPYNLKADIYSWSMLMWYIMALEPPFGLYTPRMFLDRVFTKGSRPIIKENWPEGVGDLLRTAWSEQIDERPNCEDIMRVLKLEVYKLDPQIASFMGNSSGEQN